MSSPLPPITPTEAAKRLGLDQVSDAPEKQVLRMARRGELRSIRVGRWTLIAPESVDQFLRGA